MSASGLPGKREEANRAGMRATTCSREAESTSTPVDEGCTANHSMNVRAACYDPRWRMNWTRTATLGVCGGLLVTLFARASTSVLTPPAVPVAVPARPDPAPLFADVERLRERLRASVATAEPSRNLFSFHHGTGPASQAATRPETHPGTPAAASPAAAVASRPAAPALDFVGLAEEAGPDGPVRTAILSGAGGLHFVKPGDTVAGLHVVAIRDAVVELSAGGTDAPLVLTLK